MIGSKSVSGIKVAHTNINGIRHKIDPVATELADHDIICIAETKLSHDFETCKLEIDGYKEPHRKDTSTMEVGCDLQHKEARAGGSVL